MPTTTCGTPTQHAPEPGLRVKLFPLVTHPTPSPLQQCNGVTSVQYHIARAHWQRLASWDPMVEDPNCYLVVIFDDDQCVCHRIPNNHRMMLVAYQTIKLSRLRRPSSMLSRTVCKPHQLPRSNRSTPAIRISLECICPIPTDPTIFSYSDRRCITNYHQESYRLGWLPVTIRRDWRISIKSSTSPISLMRSYNSI